jgi:hypothetical protein
MNKIKKRSDSNMPERDRDLPVPLLPEILCFYLDPAGEQWKLERFHQMTFGSKRE